MMKLRKAGYGRAMEDVLICRDTEGRTVAEVDLDETTMTVDQIVTFARERDAEIVWAHGGSPGDRFEERAGYAHLRAEVPVAGEPLAEVGAEDYGPLLARAYLGLWGHKWVEPTRPLPTDGSVVLCLEDDGRPVGLCRVWPEDRVVDQPGVVPERRGLEPSLRLLGAACALLGEGPADLDTWGESPDVLQGCARLGFAVTQQQQGWELRL